MKTKARGGPRTRRIQGNGGTLGACRQKEYLVDLHFIFRNTNEWVTTAEQHLADRPTRPGDRTAV
jgi:hypothetical protein